MRKSRSTYSRIKGWKVQAGPEMQGSEIFEICSNALESRDERLERVPCAAQNVVFRFEWNGQSYYLKHYLFKNWWKFLRLRAKISRLSRIAEQLMADGFSTPKVVCFAVKGKRMFSVSVEADADCRVSDLYLNCDAGKVSSMSRFREAFGREIGRLHASGFVHGDLRLGNILVKNPDSDCLEFIFLDNDRTRKYNQIPVRGRVKNLVQIHFVELVRNHPLSDWSDFWRGYCSTEPLVADQEMSWRNRVERKSLNRAKGKMK